MAALALILSVVVATIGLCVFVVEPLWVLPVLEWLTPNILYRVKTDEKLVGLSFDDGPHAEFTPQVLEILERYGAKATFFLIGERAERHPELARRILDEGHEIGNHCWRDGSVLRHSRERFAEELERTERAIDLATLQSSPLRKEDSATVDRGKKQIPNPPECGGFGMTREGKGDVSIEYGGEKAALRRLPGIYDRGRTPRGPTQKLAPTAGEKQSPGRPEVWLAEGLGQDSTRRGDTMAGAARSGYATKGPTQRLAPTTAQSIARFFRAPGGAAWPWQLRLAKERRYTCVLGCAYPHDPMRPPVRYICWLIKKNLQPGTIVILHDGIRDATRGIAALPEILAEGKRRELRFVSIGDLL